MKKAIFIILIAGLALFFNNRLQNSYNQSIIKTPDSGKSRTIEGYISEWSNTDLILSDEEGGQKTVVMTDQTLFLRVYVDEKDSLLGQENISLNDLIKDQFIKIDIFQNDNADRLEAIIVRQIIYADE